MLRLRFENVVDNGLPPAGQYSLPDAKELALATLIGSLTTGPAQGVWFPSGRTRPLDLEELYFDAVIVRIGSL